MTERIIKFLEDFKNNFGYTYDALSDKYIFVLSKEDEEAKYYININFINQKITSYKTLKITSKNYEELKKDMNSNKHHIAYAFPIEFDVLKYIVERLDMLNDLFQPCIKAD